MTDTPRTLAQIKAMFANNSTGDISEQDMRDFVESLVNPVAGGGFPEPTSPNRYQGQGFDFYASALGLTVPSGTGTKVPMDPAKVAPGYALYDPSNMLIPAPGIQRGGPAWALPSYTGVLLEPGVYTWVMTTRWTTSVVGYRTTGISPWQEELFDAAVQPPIDPLFGSPQYGYAWVTQSGLSASVWPDQGGFQYGNTGGLLYIPKSVTYGNVACAASVYQTSGAPMTLDVFELTIAYLGNPRG